MFTRRRTSARGLIVAPTQRVLLVCMDLPWSGPVWTPPGGGVEEGETLEQAAARELYEETGLEDAPVGPLVWRRDLRIQHRSRRTENDENTFLVEVPEYEPSTPGLTEYEQGWLKGHRWWSVAEMEASDERFSPGDLAPLVRDVLENGPSPARELPRYEHRG